MIEPAESNERKQLRKDIRTLLQRTEKLMEPSDVYIVILLKMEDEGRSSEDIRRIARYLCDDAPIHDEQKVLDVVEAIIQRGIHNEKRKARTVSN